MFHEIDSDVQDITTRAQAIHSQERRITLQSVQIVLELDASRAWFHMGITVEQLAIHVGLSPSQYYKRLKAGTILKHYPLALKAFENGETQISHIAMIGNRITPANAEVILEGIKHKSKREVEDFLARVSPNGLLRNHEVIVEKTFRMTESQAALFDRVLAVAACRGKVPSNVEGLLRASETYLNAYDPMRKAERAAQREEMRALKRQTNSNSKTSTEAEAEAEAGAEAQEILYDSRQQNSSETQKIEINLEWDEFKDQVSDSINEDLNREGLFAGGEANYIVANEPGENYGPEELKELSPLERIQALYRNKRRDPRRPIRSSVRNRVWLRDGGTCTYVHGNGGRCKQTSMLEIDHCVMVCRGGTNEESNLVLRCRFHNQFMAEQELGTNFMKKKRKEKENENENVKKRPVSVSAGAEV